MSVGSKLHAVLLQMELNTHRLQSSLEDIAGLKTLPLKGKDASHRMQGELASLKENLEYTREVLNSIP